MVVAPKSDFVYDPQAVSDIVSANLAKFNKISPHQVYLTGYSMGCRGALRTLITYPNLFSAAICSAGYAEQAGDHYLELDGNAQPTYPILDHAAGVPIAFGYSPDDATNLANNTIATIKELDAAGASCNTVCVPSAQSNDDRTLNLYAAKLFLVSLIVIWDWL